MIVNFRTISNKLYKLELNPTDTILSVKQRLAQEYALDSEKMKLIFKAKILSDNDTLQSFGIDGKGFIVLHTAPQKKSPVKPKEQIIVSKPQQPQQKESSPQQLETPKSEKSVKESPKKVEKLPSVEPLPSFTRAKRYPDPPNFHENVQKLMAMGFSECDCENALRASVGNMDRAADFLLSGYIPEAPNLISVSDVPMSEPKNITFGDDDYFDDEECDEIPASEIDDEEEDGDNSIQNFLLFRDELIRNPASLRSFLDQTAQDNPAIAGFIRDDPAGFLASIGLNPNDFDLSEFGRKSQYEMLISKFTKKEQLSIHNLENLGFDTMMVIQVFEACGKDEEMTRTCLVSMK
ncbi:UV excision repair protein Rad23 [Histomonas meleagridis]|uniref:UV excision repair protein Rad23 n=1 Tax=Histomonas meleagridis TaxID=135588 RepID=UPI0035596395|nr:UV excision repair protein Rad23 [Histomonas meleagridis]KAH0800351.1 UV excision repair protein Rad23 [Histomonas meleagridis]